MSRFDPRHPHLVLVPTVKCQRLYRDFEDAKKYGLARREAMRYAWESRPLTRRQERFQFSKLRNGCPKDR